MTIDKFGSGGKSVTISKNYVDSKFITLVKSLNLKFDKTGGKISGDIDVGSNRIANVGNPTLSEDAANKIYVDNKLESKFDKAGGRVDGYIDMNNYSICNVPNPVEDLEVTNKRYVDTKLESKVDKTGDGALSDNTLSKYVMLNNVGLVPLLAGPVDKSGYVVTEGSKLNNQHTGYKAFSFSRTGWRVNDEDVNDNFWLKIKFPKPERVYQIAVSAAIGTSVKKWILLGVNVDDGYHNWTIIPFHDGLEVDHSTTAFFQAAPGDTHAYHYYKFHILESEGKNPGLCYLQFYTIEKLYLLSDTAKL